ncbi:MAG: type II secretion system F family protein [Microthrixaceae bacterium]|nr:type II secretion system F family protein [Microthrixaceae bacterium]
MPRWTLWIGLALWIGSTMLLSRVAWFRVPPLAERLRPYVGGPTTRRRLGALSAESLRDVIGPLAAAAGDRIAGLLGVNDDLSTRLARTGWPIDANGFRLRQATWAAGSMMGAAVVAVIIGLPGAIATGVVLGAPVLSFLILEQRVTQESARWQQRVTLELPVLIEQLGMLLSSGYSLGSAIARLSRRGRGLCAKELATVSARVRQGVTEVDALREWARRADVPAIDRLVGVLALNWEASDLGALISAEARSVRREVQRGEIELIEKRAQQVWIPVTVATLLPGVIFMAVPFIDAMGRLTGR